MHLLSPLKRPLSFAILALCAQTHAAGTYFNMSTDGFGVSFDFQNQWSLGLLGRFDGLASKNFFDDNEVPVVLYPSIGVHALKKTQLDTTDDIALVYGLKSHLYPYFLMFSSVIGLQTPISKNWDASVTLDLFRSITAINSEASGTTYASIPGGIVGGIGLQIRYKIQ